MCIYIYTYTRHFAQSFLYLVKYHLKSFLWINYLLFVYLGLIPPLVFSAFRWNYEKCLEFGFFFSCNAKQNSQSSEVLLVGYYLAHRWTWSFKSKTGVFPLVCHDYVFCNYCFWEAQKIFTDQFGQFFKHQTNKS